MRRNMKKVIEIISCISVLTIATACASSGNTSIEKESSTTVDAKIIDGATTKEEMKKLYGDPDNVDYRDKTTEVWKYSFSKSHYAPFAMKAFQSVAKGEKKTLTVLFEGDVVQKTQFFNI
jgi:hypothetical protein